MLVEVFQVIVLLLIAVISHEVAHGWAADRLGDPTARLAGRLTLNPLKHVDPIGMFVVPLVLRLLGFTPFGWAKPVPVNFSRLNHPRRDMVLVALAGPGINISLAVVLSLFLRLPLSLETARMLSLAIFINLILATFNLIPIPPLDGSRVAMGLLPYSWSRVYGKLEPFGFIIMIVLLNLGALRFVWFAAAVGAAFLGVDPRVL